MKFLALGLLIANAFIFAQNASAQQVLAKEKNWTLMLQTSSQDPQGVCVMSTSDKVKKTYYSLEIMKRKGSLSPVELFIRQNGTDIQAAGLIGYFESKQVTGSFSFAQMTTDAALTTFLHIPRNTAALYKAMIEKKDFRVLTRGGLVKEQKIKFSYKGFEKVLAVFQSSCVGAASASNQDFEAEFLADLQKDIDPVAISPVNVVQMRVLLAEAFNLFLQKRQNLEALAGLRAQYASQIQELDGLNSLIARLSQQELPSLRMSLSTSESNQKKAESDLASVTSKIPSYQEQLRLATARHDAAEKAIAPYVNEYNSRVGSLSSAQGQLNDSINRLNYIDGTISRLSQEVAQLQSEARQLDYTISRLREDVRRAEYELRDAQRANNAFNESYEIRRQLDSDSSYQSALRDLTSGKRELERLDADRRSAELNMNRKQEELRACQGIAGQTCSAQQAAVEQARAAYTSANSAFESQRSRISGLQSQVDSRRSSVEREVRRVKDRLESAERDAQRRYDSVYDSFRRADLRLQVINASEIPSRVNTIRQLESERPMVQNQIANGQNQVRQFTAELASFRQRVGWDAKKAELDASADLEAEKEEQLSSAQSSKIQLERRIVNLKQEQEALKSTIASKTQLLTQSQSRAAVLNNELIPYMKRKAELDQNVNSFQAQIWDRKNRYKSLLPAI